MMLKKRFGKKAIFSSLILFLLASLLLVPATPVLAQNSAPIADAGPDQTIYLGEYAELNGTATDPDGEPMLFWMWLFDSVPEGSTASVRDQFAPKTVIAPDLLGEYVLSLAAYDGTDWSLPDTMTLTVIENLTPVTVAAADVTGGVAPLTVHFDGSGSYDPEGRSLEYFWNFGDGSFPCTEQSATHVYEHPGIYLAELMVTDDLGQYDKAAIWMTVTVNQPPVAVADAAPRTGAAPLTVHFTSADSYDPEGGQLIYTWDFGDGSPVSYANGPIHSYTATGSFDVTLTVVDEHGLQESDTVTINVLSTEPLPTPSPPGGQVTLQDIIVPFHGEDVPLSWGWELTPDTDYCIFYGYDADWDTHYLVDAVQCQADTNIRLGLNFGCRYEGEVYWPEEFEHGMFFWENEDLPLPLEVLARPGSKTEPEWLIVVTAYDGSTLTFTLDWDGDGITDNVDEDPSAPSTDFSDGNTSGSIIGLDEGISVLITDALDTNDGVMVVVSGPEDGDARIRIDGDSAGVFRLPPGEYIFTTYVDNHGKPALRTVIVKKLVARPVGFKRSDSKAAIRLLAVGKYDSRKGSVILEVSDGGLAEVEYNIGDTMTVVVIASGGSAELDETLTVDGALREVVVTAKAEGVTVNGIPLAPDTSVSPIVPIDIKPGSDPNSINLGSGGTVPVDILSTPVFDATTVDPTTVTLASAPVRLKGKGTPMAIPEDVNGDGLLDLVIHVSTEAFVISDEDQQAVLEGKTFDDIPLMGTDAIRVVP